MFGEDIVFEKVGVIGECMCKKMETRTSEDIHVAQPIPNHQTGLHIHTAHCLYQHKTVT